MEPLSHSPLCLNTVHSTQCCIQLAQGKLSTEQLTDEVLSLVSTHSPRHLSSLSLGLDSQQGDERGGSRPSAEILRMMQRLSDRAKHAQQCCSCIATCFKIAVVSCCYVCKTSYDPKFLRCIHKNTIPEFTLEIFYSSCYLCL